MAMPEAQKQIINAIGMGTRHHALVEEVHVAFSTHRPLALSPDDIWLVISQGFVHHVAEHAETLRHRLVRRQGTEELSAKVVDLSLASFEAAIANFSWQIRAATDPVLHETLICDFSTTTPIFRTASEVALMDCYANYFTYRLDCICGIPQVRLGGSVEDWQRIRDRVQVLETYGLERWISRLRPILDQFVLTASGQPSADFWKAIYKPEAAYGPKTATGWITDLFPYLSHFGERHWNYVFDHPRVNWLLPYEKNSKGGRMPKKLVGVSPDGFPSGRSSVPILVTSVSGSERNLDLVAGFFGVAQSSDLTLSPVISWAVAERPPATPVMVDPG